MPDFDFDAWVERRYPLDRGRQYAANEFRPLIEAAVEAVQGIPDGDDGDGSYWLGHLNYLQLKHALRDLGVEP